MMKKIFWGFSVGIILLAVVVGCLLLDSPSDEIADEKKVITESVAVDDTVTINIQPLDGVKSIEKYVEKFTELYLKSIGIKNYKVKVLQHKNSPDSTLNRARTRYRAAKLMNFLHNETPKKVFTIGITDKDISTTIHGAEDYGILGLSSLGYRKRACITSTYRLKHKSDLWKLMAHEFTHGFFSQGHCKRDDLHCIMQDAKGKSPKFEIKEKICSGCQAEINRKRK